MSAEHDLSEALRRSLSGVEAPVGIVAGVRARRARARRRRVALGSSGGVGAVAVAGVAAVLLGSGPAPAAAVVRPAASGASTTAAPATRTAAWTGELELPSLHVDTIIEAGGPTYPTAAAERGVERFSGTLCGAGGTGIYGHRTTYGAQFGRLDQLARGAVAIVTGPRFSCSYIAVGKVVVRPGHVPAVRPGTLQLVTDTPKFSAAERLVVTFRLRH